jgi:hypothetical protein
MRIAIIALVIALAALALAGFATFASLNDDEAAAIAESGWSEAECAEARAYAFSKDDKGYAAGMFKECYEEEHDCAPLNDMLQAIYNHCP